MTLTTHALAGAAIGKYFSNPILVIIVSIIIHYTMDTFRHGEYLNRKSTWGDTTWKVALDLCTGLILVTFLVFQINPTNISNIALAVFFSLLPDLLTLLYWKFGVKKLKFLFDFHSNIHSHSQQSPERSWTLRNSVNDIVFCTTSIIFLLL
ncbi:MAG: hypothetical protein OEV93_03145 [Candidatus Moranbacteria bacterium]|nr:hypothetical protein [Candidatus Moranbacteria bacterium]